MACFFCGVISIPLWDMLFGGFFPMKLLRL